MCWCHRCIMNEEFKKKNWFCILQNFKTINAAFASLIVKIKLGFIMTIYCVQCFFYRKSTTFINGCQQTVCSAFRECFWGATSLTSDCVVSVVVLLIRTVEPRLLSCGKSVRHPKVVPDTLKNFVSESDVGVSKFGSAAR